MKVAIAQTGKLSTRSEQNKERKASKSIPLPSSQIPTQLDETGKLSIAQCKAILCEDGEIYSDEQVALIRQVLYALAEVDYQYHTRLKEQKQRTTIPIHTTHDEQQDRYSLHPRIYRRTG